MGFEKWLVRSASYTMLISGGVLAVAAMARNTGILASLARTAAQAKS